MLEKITKDLLAWCHANFLLIKKIDLQIFEFPKFGKAYLVLPVDSKILDEEMCFLFNENGFEQEQLQVWVENKEIDYLIFTFGQQWYHCKPVLKKDSFNEQRFAVDFQDLKYVGTNTLEYDVVANPLGIHTEYEILNGNGLKNYIKKAKFFNYTHAGICDKNTLAGTLAWQSEAQKGGIKSIIGETIDVATNYNPNEPNTVPITYELKLYVATWEGWQNLLQINKRINVDYRKFIPEAELQQFQQGLIAVVGAQSYLNFTNKKEVLKWLGKFSKFEGKYFQVDCGEFYAPGDDLKRLQVIQEYLKSGLQKLLLPIMLNDIYYCDKEMYIVKDYINKVAKKAYDYSEDQYFKSYEEIVAQMLPLFRDEQSADFVNLLGNMIENLNKVCEQCGTFEIETGERRFPVYESLDGIENEELFLDIIVKGFKEKVIDAGLDENIYMKRLQTELEVIHLGGIVSYFLILWDIIRWAKDNGIRVGTGRGSVCGSLVAYVMDLTDVDPIFHQLLFERFLNEVRALPDIKYEIEYIDGTKEVLSELEFKKLNIVYEDKK
jgi:DNA polymerase III subunit alpha